MNLVARGPGSASGAVEWAAGISVASCRAPKRRSGLVQRDDLVKRMIDVPAEETIVITAPAGYGKTTTLLLWDEADRRLQRVLNVFRVLPIGALVATPCGRHDESRLLGATAREFAARADYQRRLGILSN